ncbi:hypothetical protein ANCCEY_06849 [Ancylostoma ceylanicum]|uniref:Uncharacterized protein n=1 Tax=Ancylostoma ceylanicum TaxID=53326 RepID=A0A0D6M2D9_9BILA|nr:hypothetical protein ANCCEY_06849 [Ancylostoma ceylanicum]
MSALPRLPDYSCREYKAAAMFISEYSAQAYLVVRCNYLGFGDETVQTAAPIARFATSGDNFGPDFCIAKCKHGNSIKAAINFHLSNSSAPAFTVKSYRSSEGKRTVTATKANGVKDDDDDGYKQSHAACDGASGSVPLGPCWVLSDGNLLAKQDFCMDDDVKGVADVVFATYKDVETIAKALNYYLNKPGWAFLVYKMGPPPSFVFASNMLKDPNVCMRSYWMMINGQFEELQLLAGKVKWSSM